MPSWPLYFRFSFVSSWGEVVCRPRVWVSIAAGEKQRPHAENDERLRREGVSARQASSGWRFILISYGRPAAAVAVRIRCAELRPKAHGQLSGKKGRGENE